MIERVREIAVDASKFILEIYHQQDLTVETKSDNSPVTKADLVSHDFITNALAQSFPYPVLSEEYPVPYEE